ncbi:MAG: ABC transporter ATP-binding protein [Clostridiales bacterium]|nr:ABC transporter ATP-binding protein [Clostridiales bacterium]
MIEIKNLTKKYGEHVALNDVSLKLEKFKITGFLGPNGAGKTTLMNIITGYIMPEYGEIIIDQSNIHKNLKKAKSKIGYLAENTPLYVEMTVIEFIKFICQLRKIDKIKKRKDLEVYIKNLLVRTQIYNIKNKVIKNLSKGYKQRVGLAGTLVGEPDIIILDEPTVGLDPKQKLDTLNQIKKLSENHTIIISSHILSEISSICEKIVIINHGKILADSNIEDLYKKINEQNKINVIIKGYKNNILNVLWNIEGVIRVKIQNKIEKDTYEILVESKIEKCIKKDLQISLVENNMELLSLKDVERDLEDVFLKFIQKDENMLPKRELYNMDFGHNEINDSNIDDKNDIFSEPKVWEVDLGDFTSNINKKKSENTNKTEEEEENYELDDETCNDLLDENLEDMDDKFDDEENNDDLEDEFDEDEDDENEEIEEGE